MSRNQKGEGRATAISFTEAQKIPHNPRKGSESLGSVAWAEFPRNQGITLGSAARSHHYL